VQRDQREIEKSWAKHPPNNRTRARKQGANGLNRQYPLEFQKFKAHVANSGEEQIATHENVSAFDDFAETAKTEPHYFEACRGHIYGRLCILNECVCVLVCSTSLRSVVATCTRACVYWMCVCACVYAQNRVLLWGLLWPHLRAPVWIECVYVCVSMHKTEPHYFEACRGHTYGRLCILNLCVCVFVCTQPRPTLRPSVATYTGACVFWSVCSYAETQAPLLWGLLWPHIRAPVYFC